MSPADRGERPLRVLQVVTTLSLGGAQATVVHSSIDHEPIDGRAVEVVIAAGPDDLGEGSWADHIDELGISRVTVPSLHRAIRPLADLRAVRQLVRLVDDLDPDVVHSHSSKAGGVTRVAVAVVRARRRRRRRRPSFRSRRRIRMVHTVHGWATAREEGLHSAVVRAVERRLAPLADHLVVVTDEDRRQGLAWGIGTPDQYRLVRSGLDLSLGVDARRERAESRRLFGVDDDAVVVGAVARHAMMKRLDVLLDAYACSPGRPQDRLVLIGDGPLRAELEARVDRLGIADRVVFVGHREDAAVLVGGFDLFALTSDTEGLPRSVIEAMSAGVPVMSTLVGGLAEVVEDGITGRTIPTGDPEAIAAVLTELRGDPGQRARLADAAMRHVATFDESAMRADLAAVWSGRAALRAVPEPAPAPRAPAEVPTDAPDTPLRRRADDAVPSDRTADPSEVPTPR